MIRRARSRGPTRSWRRRADAAQTVDGWLDGLRPDARAMRDWLWHPLALAALNQSPDTAAAAPFVRVVASCSARRPRIRRSGLPRVPLDELYAEPAQRFVEARGGAVHLRTPATVVIGTRRRACVGVRTPDRA